MMQAIREPRSAIRNEERPSSDTSATSAAVSDDRVTLREAEVAEILGLAPRTFRHYRELFCELGLVRLKCGRLVRYAKYSIKPLMKNWANYSSQRATEEAEAAEE